MHGDHTRKTSKSTMALFRTKRLTLAIADEMASLAVRAAQANRFSPIAVTVMDPDGNEIVSKRMDGCPPMAYSKLAVAKANTCVSVQMSTRAYGNKYLKGSDGIAPATPDVYVRGLNQIISVNSGLVAFPGGVVIRDAEGDIVGSVGVSGAAGDEDEYCALAAVQECSAADELVTEPLEHSCKTLKSEQ